MSTTAQANSSNQLGDVLEHLGRHWAERRRLEARSGGSASDTTTAYTIALARETGTQGTAIAREVGKLLDWHVYDHELLERIAQDMGVRANLLESVDERRVNWLLESIESFMSGPMVSESGYVKHLTETMLALATHGQCVIVGRGSAQILPTGTTLRVRLVANLQDRIAQTRQKLGLSAKEVQKRVEATDREHIAFVREHFMKDPTNPENYDLIINTSRFSVSQAATLIVAALHQLEELTA